MKQQKRPRDINKRAASTVAIATGQVEEEVSEYPQEPGPTPEEQHKAAVALGKRGGQARAKRLTAEQRKKIAKIAADARWKKG